jgi:pantoate--beta-alanine ligase
MPHVIRPKAKTMTLPIVRTVADLRAHVAGWRRQGLRIGLVPTMGALHDGHLTLVRHARTRADRVVASVFVNPTQFGPNEDFSLYPRDETGDAAKLAAAGCDLLFAPDASMMYPPGFSTAIDVGPVTRRWEGACRPGHFQGVATVVAKLLLQAGPDVACFGEKDYQQLCLIRQLVRDLDIPVAIDGVPTVREADGLALSSRNAYLTADQRQVAGQLNHVMREVIARLLAGADVAQSVAAGEAALLGLGFAAIDYLAVVDAATLEPLGALSGRSARLICTARLGGVRLLDNMPVT